MVKNKRGRFDIRMTDEEREYLEMIRVELGQLTDADTVRQLIRQGLIRSGHNPPPHLFIRGLKSKSRKQKKEASE